MEKRSSLKLEDVLPFRYGFLKALPIYLLGIAAVIFWIWVLRFSNRPIEMTVFDILLTGISGTVIVLCMAYFLMYGALFSLVSAMVRSDVAADFLDKYTRRNIWGYNVWAFQPEGKELQCIVLPRNIRIAEFLCENFFDQALCGYVLRYPAGGWFRRAATLWFIENHHADEGEIQIVRCGRTEDCIKRQEFICRDDHGSTIKWPLSSMFDHLVLRGSACLDNLAGELRWLRDRYLETEIKRLGSVK